MFLLSQARLNTPTAADLLTWKFEFRKTEYKKSTTGRANVSTKGDNSP
jgi:hypothetical protein